MIITRLTGGLGNQMFQYAAGLALADKRRTVLKLDVSWFRENTGWAPHGRYALDGFLLPAQFSTEDESLRASGVRLTRSERFSLTIARLLHFRQYERGLPSTSRLHRPGSFRFSPDFFSLPDGTFLDGLFQSELFFQPVSLQVRRHFSFRFPLSARAKEILESVQSRPSAFVHLRRGDYITDPRFGREIGILSARYYRAAIDRLSSLHPGVRLHVFSDDPSGAAEFLNGFSDLSIVDPNRQLDAHETLRLMASCQHAIVANSSFSWWAAWLMDHPGKTVIAPSPWYVASTHDTSDLVPKSWSTQLADFVS